MARSLTEGAVTPPPSRLLEFTRWGNRRLSEATWIRRAGIATYRTAVAAVRFLPGPRILLNGHFKSGTHLLSDCVALMPRTVFSGRHFTLSQFLDDERIWADAFSSLDPRPAIHRDRLRRYLALTPPGMFATAHLGHRPDVEEVLDGLGFRQVLLLRDPRDVVVSHVKFVLRQRSHFDHRYYAEVLRDDESRLLAAIRGFDPPVGTGMPHPSIGESTAGYLGWRGLPNVLVTRYETLVGPAGGGDRAAQLEEIRRIGDFLGRDLSTTSALGIAERMYSSKSYTFRRGGTGDWREHFTPTLRDAFKEVAGKVLIELGYEDDLDW